VLDPLKVVIDNLPEDHEETIRFPNHPKDESFGERTIPFSREVWIERGDFAEVPPRGFRRLKPDGEVRLRGIGIVKCVDVVKDDAGMPATVHVTLDPDTRPGCENANRKVKGTIHWVSARHGVATEVRLYDRLFDIPDPDAGDGGYQHHINPESRRIVQAWLEPAAVDGVTAETCFQFERLGYFIADREDHAPDRPVFNRTVTLRDTWTSKAGR